jgi:hypothetical protein
VSEIDLSGYQSLLQLAAGLNLVVPGYDELRQRVEDGIEKSLNRARDKMNEVHTKFERSGSPFPGSGKSPAELRAEIKDIADCYFKRRKALRAVHSFLQPVLLVFALISIGLLAGTSIGWLPFEERTHLLEGTMVLYLPAFLALLHDWYCAHRLRREFARKVVQASTEASIMHNKYS